MPRTFSLAALLVVITLFCVVCGLAVSKSEEAQAYLLTVASIAPAAIVCLTLVSFSRRRQTVLTLSLVGTTIGAFWGLPVHTHGPMTVWEAIGPVFIPIAITSTLGALLFGGATLLNDFFSYHKPTPHDERLDQDHEIQRLLQC